MAPLSTSSQLVYEESNPTQFPDVDRFRVHSREEHMVVGGDVAPGYEAVRDEFLRNFQVGHVEEKAQVCAYVKGVRVVDLWARRIRLHKWGEDHSNEDDELAKYNHSSIQNVWSSSKAVTSVVVAMLVDRGHLRYEQKVGEVWPEYACNGKEETTVIHVLRHEAGLASLDKSIAAADLRPERIKVNAVGEIIARQKPAHVPGTKRVYHSLTRGWIINEIVRRVDPKGRTVGEFLQEEVAGQLGLKGELAIGLPDEVHHRAADLKERPLSWTMRQLMLPRWAGGGRVPGTSSLITRAVLMLLLPLLSLVTALNVAGGIGLHVRPNTEEESDVVRATSLRETIAMFNRAELRKSEIPSANCHASAHALAKIANAVVAGFFGQENPIIGKDGARKMHMHPNKKNMFHVVPFRFSDGGVCMFGPDRSDFIGWMGLGGSVLQWNLEEQIGFGYAMTCHELMPNNIRGMRLQRVTRDCAIKVRQAKEAANSAQIARL